MSGENIRLTNCEISASRLKRTEPVILPRICASRSYSQTTPELLLSKSNWSGSQWSTELSQFFRNMADCFGCIASECFASSTQKVVMVRRHMPIVYGKTLTFFCKILTFPEFLMPVVFHKEIVEEYFYKNCRLILHNGEMRDYGKHFIKKKPWDSKNSRFHRQIEIFQGILTNYCKGKLFQRWTFPSPSQSTVYTYVTS